MGILRKLREWRENEDGTLEGPSLKTDVLQNGQGDPWATWENAGYADGDVALVANYTGYSLTGSTSSQTFTEVSSLGRFRINWGDILGGADQIKTSMTVRFTQSGDNEEMGARYYNSTDNETLVSVSGGPDTFYSGWVDYTPTTTNDLTTVRFEAQTDNGDSVTIAEPTLYIGVEL